MVGFSSYILKTSKVTIEVGGYKTFIMNCLKGSFFNNSDKGTGILFLLNSCSRMKDSCGLSASFTLGTIGLNGRGSKSSLNTCQCFMLSGMAILCLNST
jgi:hypothetical protein